MLLALALALLALGLYMSTLSYALRDYWRSELSERLGRSRPRGWLEWLEANESELQVLAGFVRITAVVGVVICIQAWYAQATMPSNPWDATVVPGLIALALLLIFTVAIPHGLALHVGETALLRSLWVMLVLRTLLWPVARVLAGFEFIIRRLLGKSDKTADEATELMEQEILEAVSEGEAYGAVDEEQKEIIESVFRLDDTTVSAIMTPRTDIHAIQADATLDEVRARILRSGHSRIPVYEESVDHIIGVLYAKDLLRLNPGDRFSTRQLMRIVPYVPETKSVSELLGDFRRSRVQIAIVLDEYGGTAGLVTIEDILEELVGEIDDEYDQRTGPVTHRIDPDTLEVDARVRVDEVNAELGVSLPDQEDYDTIGGFVFSTLGRIPAVGEEFAHEQVQFRVIDAEARKINRLRIHVQREKAESA